MSLITKSVFIATLGGQPQVVSLALDILLQQGEQIDEVIVVHLADHIERYRKARQRLAKEFIADCYNGWPIHYRPLPITYQFQAINDLDSDVAIEAVSDTLLQLLQRLKQQGQRIHLCPTGGRRMLGMLALTAAQLYLSQSDRVWHLFSSDEVRRQTDRGALMHLPPNQEVKLVRVPIATLGQMMPWLREPYVGNHQFPQKQIDNINYKRCQQVIDRLTPRQREVLQAFVRGLDPQQVAAELDITVGAVHYHKKTIYHECIVAWELDEKKRLNFHWLREAFADFFNERSFGE